MLGTSCLGFVHMPYEESTFFFFFFFFLVGVGGGGGEQHSYSQKNILKTEPVEGYVV